MSWCEERYLRGSTYVTPVITDDVWPRLIFLSALHLTIMRICGLKDGLLFSDDDFPHGPWR